VTAPKAKQNNWNLPNALTTLRIVMVPFFGWALLVDGGDSVLWRTVAWAIFAAAMVTDKIDGDIARSRDLVTDFGKIADPIADKALTGMAFVGLSIVGDLWWWVTVLVLLREWGITLLRLWVIRYGVMAAGSGGKLKTVLQTVALGLFILPLKLLSGPWETVGLVVWWIAVALMAAAVTLTLVTGVDYVVKALAVRRDGRADLSPR
jgi:CDP-diacylglycerol--glycerol-3-phosphate 3-phosphatidyltransferase